MQTIVPADLSYLPDGTPYSARFGDVYHSVDGGAAQARHVFLGGAQVAQRWAGRPRFTILENGFGLGTNFLVTWDAWRETGARSERLCYVGLDRHPPTSTDLRLVHARTPLAPSAHMLADQWPSATPGMHRCEFDGGRVVLLLAWGDAIDTARELVCCADALYLDGFAPSRNPEMWSAALIDTLAARCAAEATVATWSVARPVRDALTDAGFHVETAPGFGRKREMTVGRRAPTAAIADRPPAPDTAVVVGAGLAGCATAHALAARGVGVTLVDRRDGAARATSSNPIGVVQPVIGRDNRAAVRFTRAAFFDAVARIRRLGGADAWAGLGGVLHVAKSDEGWASEAASAASRGAPEHFARPLGVDEACALTGVQVPRGGWWFPHAGWVRPRAYAHALLDAVEQPIERRFGFDAVHVVRDAGRWVVTDASRAVIAVADRVVLAGAYDVPGVSICGSPSTMPLRAVRGQLSAFDAHAVRTPRVVVAGDGYVTPTVDGQFFAGATYEYDDDPSIASRSASDDANVARVARLTGLLLDPATRASARGHVGWRAVAPDRLPLVGAWPSQGAADPSEAPWVVTGLASRGITWCGLAGDIVAAAWCGEPMPVERSVLDALDPMRFARSQKRL